MFEKYSKWLSEAPERFHPMSNPGMTLNYLAEGYFAIKDLSNQLQNIQREMGGKKTIFIPTSGINTKKLRPKTRKMFEAVPTGCTGIIMNYNQGAYAVVKYIYGKLGSDIRGDCVYYTDQYGDDVYYENINVYKF